MGGAFGLRPSLPMRVRVMPSLGDAVYCHPLVKRLALKHPVRLETKWPDIYRDIAFQEGEEDGETIRPRYDSRTLCFNNILRCIEHFFTPDDAPLIRSKEHPSELQ